MYPQSERYSDWWDENDDCVYVKTETSLIDHIMVSPGLASKILNVFYAHDEFAMTCTTYYSDHWPVVIDFAL